LDESVSSALHGGRDTYKNFTQNSSVRSEARHTVSKNEKDLLKKNKSTQKLNVTVEKPCIEIKAVSKLKISASTRLLTVNLDSNKACSGKVKRLNLTKLINNNNNNAANWNSNLQGSEIEN